MMQRGALALCLAATTAAFAADPLPGMWAFDGELTGQPGRGFQIDTQGSDVLIVSYFGYRADGSALFLQASGPRAADGSFEADLVEYRNGTVLGGAHQDGEQAQVVGRVQAVFDAPTAGSITLPGEQPRRVTRFQYVDNAPWFNQSFSADKYGPYAWSTKAQFTMAARDGVFTMAETETMNRTDGSTYSRTCQYEGSYTPAGTGLRSAGTVQCEGASATSYRAEALELTRDGFFSGRIYVGNSDTPMTYQGYCRYTGPVFPTAPPLRCAPAEQ